MLSSSSWCTVSTLVSRLNEADEAVNGLEAYQQQCQQTQDLLDKSKKEVNSLRAKLSAAGKEKASKDATIKDLQDSLARSKRVAIVTRQGRARSEENVKKSQEEISSLKEQIEKMEGQMTALKKDKVDAQNAKIAHERKARVSATKLRDLTEECNRKGSAKTVEELEKRVNVLNNTVSGLASTNSKLRGELAAIKLKKKSDEDAESAPPKRRSGISSRERPMSSRSKSLEEQVNELKRSLLQEKTDSSKTLERYQRKIEILQKSLQSAMAAEGTNSEELEQQVSSLTSENKSLKATIASKVDENIELKKENERLSQIGMCLCTPM